jgi:quercetin dioxygenase-like cupin family protein
MTRSDCWKVRGLTLVGLALGGVLGVGVDRLVLAQQSGIKRTPLVTVDEPGAPGYEAIMGIAEIPSGGTSGRHYHHGVEIGYVLDGTLVIEHQGRPVQTLKAGEPFRIDPNAAHEAKASGSAVSILTVHMVEKGKPLAEPAK